MSWKYYVKPSVSMYRALQLLRRPVVTEASARDSGRGMYWFEVDTLATKPEIRAAVEQIFKVDVVSVNVLNRRGKARRFKGHWGRCASRRHAVVRLREGQSIDYSSVSA